MTITTNSALAAERSTSLTHAARARLVVGKVAHTTLAAGASLSRWTGWPEVETSHQSTRLRYLKIHFHMYIIS